MVERVHQGEFIPGEEVKREAAARHLRVYRNPEQGDLELSERKRALQILARDTKIPIIERILEEIEAKHNIK